MTLGILFAFGALFSWGFGDYFIQKSTRAVGDWRALFYIGVFGAVVLLPFVYGDIPLLLRSPRWLVLLSALGVVTFFAALFDFEALKEGKIAVIEPVLGLELPLTAALSFAIWGEELSRLELFLAGLVCIGITFAITRERWHLHYHKRIFERGVIYAGLGMIGMALVNFLTGVGAQTTNPLLTMWVVNVYLAVLCFVYIAAKQGLKEIPRDLRQSLQPIFFESVFDNLAWVFYASSMALIPISIATAISESYIILTVFLGIRFNHEKLKLHQKVGAAVAIIGIIGLSVSL